MRAFRVYSGSIAGSEFLSAKDQGQDEKDNENQEQDLGDAGRCTGDSAEAEYRSDQRNDKKDNGVMKHGNLLGDWASIAALKISPSFAMMGSKVDDQR